MPDRRIDHDDNIEGDMEGSAREQHVRDNQKSEGSMPDRYKGIEA